MIILSATHLSPLFSKAGIILLPMLIQTLSFKYVYNHFLNANPVSAIQFAGVLLLIGAAFVLRIKTTEKLHTND